jgi:hypothetical protein
VLWPVPPFPAVKAVPKVKLVFIVALVKVGEVARTALPVPVIVPNPVYFISHDAAVVPEARTQVYWANVVAA